MPEERAVDAAVWDARYRHRPQVWSGEPNGALVAEVQSLPPGAALDIGCGEGADAVWLAGRGWAVTALDPSSVALIRAARHGADARVPVRWVHAGLVDTELLGGPFDLVSMQYPALHRAGTDLGRMLLPLVAPGGRLIVVHHADVDRPQALAHGFDPDELIGHDDVRAALDGDWVVEADERRPRRISSGAGAGHTHDLVLHARRSG